METLGSRLKEARENKRLTQLDVAKIIGISNGTLSGYERDYRDPDTVTLKRLSDLYGVKVDYLLTGEKNNLNQEQMIDRIMEEAGNPHTTQRDKFANEFLKILPSVSDDAKKIILDLLKHLKDK